MVRALAVGGSGERDELQAGRFRTGHALGRVGRGSALPLPSPPPGLSSSAPSPAKPRTPPTWPPRRSPPAPPSRAPSPGSLPPSQAIRTPQQPRCLDPLSFQPSPRAPRRHPTPVPTTANLLLPAARLYRLSLLRALCPPALFPILPVSPSFVASLPMPAFPSYPCRPRHLRPVSATARPRFSSMSDRPPTLLSPPGLLTAPSICIYKHNDG